MASWRLSSKRTWAVGVLALSLILSDCAAAPRLSDSSPASTAPLIPVAVFFANRESNYDYKVSPDGGRLAWLASAGGRLTVHFRELQGGDAGTGVATLELTEVNGQPAPGGGQPGESSAIRRHLVVVVGFSVGKEHGDGDERRGRGRRRIRKTWRGGAIREDQREGEDPHCPRPLAR